MPANELDKRAQRHLENDVVIWFTSVGPDRRPHTRLVWFLWDEGSFLIYSVPGQKVKDVEANPNVVLHFNSDREGSFEMRFEGVAEIDGDEAPANRNEKYLAKYRDLIKDLGMTSKGFAEQYHVAVRVRPTRLRA